jgi:hypothetical protein
MDHAQFVTLLSQTQLSDNDLRPQAEAAYNNYCASGDAVLISLSRVMTDASLPVQVRFGAHCCVRDASTHSILPSRTPFDSSLAFDRRSVVRGAWCGLRRRTLLLV